MAQTRSARDLKSTGKTRIGNLQYPENEVGKIFIISLRLIEQAGKENFQI